MTKDTWKDEKERLESSVNESAIFTPIITSDDQVKGVIGIIEDVTEKTKAEEALREANKKMELAKIKAEEANDAKSRYLIDMSHEIRTPINGILGFIHLLEESDLNQEQKENLAYIKYSTNNLLSLLNDILDLSKIESGKMTLDLTTFDIRLELDSIIAPFRHLSSQKKVDFSVDIDENLPQEVCSDPIKLGQIINNLLSNAVKFTNKGSIRMSVSLADEKFIQIVVKDTGFGIPDEVLDNLFIPYSQGAYSVNHSQKGTGLGLRIAKNLVELMHGRISVESVKGRGSIFTVIIPIG